MRIIRILITSVIAAYGFQAAQAKSPDEALAGLNSAARDWVNRSCPQSLGPSLWSSCIVRESTAASRGKPELSGLKPEFQSWIKQSCPDSLGPSLTISCLNREKAALSGGLPDMSSLTEEQKQWVSNSCPASLGPSLFVSCIQRESAALRGTTITPQQPPTAPAPPQHGGYSAPPSQSAPDSYVIEVAHNDELFVINGEKFEAQTYCLGWEEGDDVLFLEGSPFGACTSAELFNLRTREKCDVWCE